VARKTCDNSVEFFELVEKKKCIFEETCRTKRNQEESDQVIGLATVLNLSIEQGTALNNSLLFVLCEQQLNLVENSLLLSS
jgi:hypothetical protein